MLGNWTGLVKDIDSDGPDANGSDITEARNHNSANELTSQDVNGDSTFEAQHTYDHAGNVVTQQVGNYFPNPLVTKHFTHDLWNQLVKVAYEPYQSSSVTRAEYRYNALNWRIQKTADIGPNGVPDATLDQRRDMYYSANWQMLEEYINDDIVGQLGPNRRTQYIWGPRYIDDIVMRRQDNNADGAAVVNETSRRGFEPLLPA